MPELKGAGRHGGRARRPVKVSPNCPMTQVPLVFQELRVDRNADPGA